MTAETIAKHKTGRPPGRPKQVLDWQASYMRRAWRIRRALTNKALAEILELSVSTVKNYTSNLYRARNHE